jgi:hypothetical protein
MNVSCFRALTGRRGKFSDLSGSSGKFQHLPNWKKTSLVNVLTSYVNFAESYWRVLKLN